MNRRRLTHVTSLLPMMASFSVLSPLLAGLGGCGLPLETETETDADPGGSTTAPDPSPPAEETGGAPGEQTSSGSGPGGLPSDGGTGSAGGICDDNGTCDPGEDAFNCPNDCDAGTGGSCNDNGICDEGEDPVSCPDDCFGGESCNNNGNCEEGEGPKSCPNDCQGGGTCNNNGNCDLGEDPGSCPSDCDGGGGCNNNGNCDPGENAGSCPNDCGGGGADCNNNNTCDPGEDETSCPDDCLWYLADIETPEEVAPETISPLLEDFPAPDEVMCELPELCPGPITTFVDPWTGAHAERELERSREEIVQVNARGQRAWTYFALTAIEGDADEVYNAELQDAMRVALDGSTYPVESGSLNVHPARPGMWDYLTAAGQSRITESGYEGIDIDGGFFSSYCFDADTLSSFATSLVAELTSEEIQEIEDELAAEGFAGIVVDADFNYRQHLVDDRGFTSESELGGESRLLKIDRQWDKHVDDQVFASIDTYLTDLQTAATSAGQGDFPVFLNRSVGHALWTTADRFDLMGGETFINDENISYPSEYRMAPYFRQGRIFDKRVWSWNSPRVLDPFVDERVMDSVLVYIAENDAAGGLLQIPDESIKYPLCPEEEPLCDATPAEMDALRDKIAPYLSYREQIRELLDHDPQSSVLAIEMLGRSDSVWNGDAVFLDFAALGIGALLGDYQIDYEVTGWGDGDYLHRLAETPWVDQSMLDGYDWIFLAEPHLLSDGQITMLNNFTAGGGILVVLLYSDSSCEGADQTACELKSGCRFDAGTPSCDHVVDQLTGTPGTNLFVVDDVDVMAYRDDPTARAAARASFDAALTGVTLPREMTSVSSLVDLAVFHSRRSGTDLAHIWHLVNYSWDEGTLSAIARTATTVELQVPAELEGQTVNVTWFSAPDQRVELQSEVVLGTGGGVTLSVDLPGFDIWGTLVLTTGDHEAWSDPRPRPPYVKVSSYMPGSGMNWQFQFEAVSSHASLDRAYLWGREMVETEPDQWEATGPWRALYEYDFTEGGTVDAGLRQDVTFAIDRPSAVDRLQIYATACDVEDLCQPFIPWAVMTRPPTP